MKNLLALFLFMSVSYSSMAATQLQYYERENCDHSGGVSKEAQDIIRNEFGLTNINIVICSNQVKSQSIKLKNIVKFEKALRLGIGALLNQTGSEETPLNTVLSTHFNELDSKDALLFAKTLLKNQMNVKTAKLVLLNTTESAIEGSDDGKEDWVIYLNIPDYIHMFFVDIQRNGKESPYVWGIN